MCGVEIGIRGGPVFRDGIQRQPPSDSSPDASCEASTDPSVVMVEGEHPSPSHGRQDARTRPPASLTTWQHSAPTAGPVTQVSKGGAHAGWSPQGGPVSPSKMSASVGARPSTPASVQVSAGLSTMNVASDGPRYGGHPGHPGGPSRGRKANVTSVE